RFAWSTAGRLAVMMPSHDVAAQATIAVFDERGRVQARFPGRSFAWSPDGRRLASVASGRLEVRSLPGRVLFRKAVPGLRRGQHNGLVWVDGRRVLVGGIEHPLRPLLPVAVDIATGRITPFGNNRYFGTLSPDRSLVAGIAYRGRSVALTVSRLDGSGARTLTRRALCPDLVEGDVEWFPDGRSLAYDFKCQSTRS